MLRWKTDAELAQRIGITAEQLGSVMDYIKTGVLNTEINLGDCERCGGWGRIGDDIPCMACNGTGGGTRNDTKLGAAH